MYPLCYVSYYDNSNLYFQDLKPSNIAVNEDCELKVRFILLLFARTEINV